MTVVANPQFTKDYFDPEKRYIGNSVRVFFKDGSSTGAVSIDVPIGHRRRRAEGIPLLQRKFEAALAGHLPPLQAGRIVEGCRVKTTLDSMPIHRFMDWFAF